MRNMSFMLTTEQIKNETKICTRRLGWKFLKKGDRIQAVEKCQGLKKGEKINRLKVIEITDVLEQSLDQIDKQGCIDEGFPDMSPEEFVDMFCQHMKCKPDQIVRVIYFRYEKS